MPRRRRSRAEAFLRGFVLPLVSGGELHVGEPLDAEDLEDLRADVTLAAEGVLSVDEILAIEGARQARAAALWLYPVPTPWDERSLRCALALHNLLFLGHPDASGWAVRRGARRRLVRFTRGLLGRTRPLALAEIIAQHTLLGGLLQLERTDIKLESWAVSYEFRGQTPAPSLRRWPRLRRVREESRRVCWLFDEALAEPQVSLLAELLEQSPLTDLLAPHRPRPAFGWLRVAPYLVRPIFCRLVGHLYLELGLEVVGPGLARAFWELASRSHCPPEGQGALRLVVGLVCYLQACRCLTGEGDQAQGSNPVTRSDLSAPLVVDDPRSDLSALLVAADSCALLPAGEVLGDPTVERRLRANLAATRARLGGEADNLTAQLRAALE